MRSPASTYLPVSTGHGPGRRRFAGLLSVVAIAIGLLSMASAASASKQAVDFFGGNGDLGGQFSGTGDVVVNNSGAGPANAGDVYVLDPGTVNAFNRHNRIERFGRDDNGTPADPADDTFFFISAWGADVDATPSGGSDYEICTVAADCKPAVASGGNGTQAGNGALDAAQSLALDEDTGNLYVSDRDNSRINVYGGDGAFLRSFGYDVVASGPGDVDGADEQQQLTVKASGGKLSLSFAGATTGAVGTGKLTNGSKTINQVETTSGAFAVGQVITAGKGFPAGTTITAVGVNQLTVSQSASNAIGIPVDLVADGLSHNASAAEVEAALDGLPTIGGVGGSVSVSGGPGNEAGSSPYTITFAGTLAGKGVPTLSSHSGLTTGSGTPSVTVTTPVPGGAYEVCEAAADICQAGAAGAGAGELGEPGEQERPPTGSPPVGIAVTPADGNPADGAVFVADGVNRRVNAYGLDGSFSSSFGSAAIFNERFSGPEQVAVDARGIVYISAGGFENPRIERYDSENANGGGPGFLTPIFASLNERQVLVYKATAGQFRLSFDPDGPDPQPSETTPDLPFNATATQVREALEALPSIGAGNVSVSQEGLDGVESHVINFVGSLALSDVSQLVVSNGSTPLSGTIEASTTRNGHVGPLIDVAALAVDPDGDGVGPDGDVLYVLSSGSGIQQYGPVNAPGLTAAPTAVDDTHATTARPSGGTGLALDEATGRFYATTLAATGFPLGYGVYVFGDAGPPPTASLDSLSGPTSHSVTAHGTIDPNGPPDTSYHFEYSTDGVKWASTPTVVLGHQEDPQAIVETIDPPPVGLKPNTEYQVRFVVERKFATPIVTSQLSFTTDPAKPIVETTGTPVRTTTTAQLQGRVVPNGSASTYHFEYGSQGPCDANPCTATPETPAGSGSVSRLVAEAVEGLEPSTTYHYRVVADNSVTGAPIAGGDMTVTTRATDAPLTHGHFPGPPGSDRAWELVSLADSGGNPVFQPLGFSSDGDHAAYQVAGGTPISEGGSAFGLYYSERTSSGWQAKLVSPKRDQLIGPNWYGLYGDFGDFSSLVSINGDLATNTLALWRLVPGGQPAKLLQPTLPREFAAERPEGAFVVSDDASRTIALVKGGAIDPAHPDVGTVRNLYDLSSGSPSLASLLPGEKIAACGVDAKSSQAIGSAAGQSSHWLSADGSLLYFVSCGALYVRDLDAEETKSIGPGSFLRSVPGAAFFASAASLDPADTGGNDVYRYDVESAGVECLTCVVPGLNANVAGDSPNQITVSADGSRVYFSTGTRLTAGAPDDDAGAYSLRVASGELNYVAPLSSPDVSYVSAGAAFSDDGRFFAFASSDPDLNPLGGALTNGGTTQYYLYDDARRSLTCVTCPADGSPPLAALPPGLLAPYGKSQANLGPLANDGTFAFTTTTPLVGADQNTPKNGAGFSAGTDVYEWRDGRQLLVSDGLNNWSGGLVPDVVGISPSGRDVYFSASAQYTPDALDAFRRYYDARIGGGIEFPPPPKPCPLEVCQGTPKGAPEEQAPGTGAFVGPANVAGAPAARCRKGKVRRKGRCVVKHKKARQHRRANDNRRTAR